MAMPVREMDVKQVLVGPKDYAAGVGADARRGASLRPWPAAQLLLQPQKGMCPRKQFGSIASASTASVSMAAAPQM